MESALGALMALQPRTTLPAAAEAFFSSGHVSATRLLVLSAISRAAAELDSLSKPGKATVPQTYANTKPCKISYKISHNWWIVSGSGRAKS